MANPLPMYEDCWSAHAQAYGAVWVLMGPDGVLKRRGWTARSAGLHTNDTGRHVRLAPGPTPRFDFLEMRQTSSCRAGEHTQLRPVKE